MSGASGLGPELGKVGLEFFQQPVEAVHTNSHEGTDGGARLLQAGFGRRQQWRAGQVRQAHERLRAVLALLPLLHPPEGRVCLWRKIRFSFLESHRVTRLAAGGTLSGGRYHDVTRVITVVGSIRIGCLR